MQNKSYDRYIELLRAAELQKFQTSSARFLASVGTASTGSWLARNPLAAFMTSLTSIVLIVLVVFSLRPAAVDMARSPAGHHSTISTSSAQNGIAPALPLSIVKGHVADVERATSDAVEDVSVLPSMPISDEGNALAEISVVEARADHQARNMSRAPLTLIQSYEPIGHEDHSWSLSLSSRELGQSDKINLRFAALTEIGSDLSIGLAGGIKTRNFERSDFAGFKDTFFVIEGREMSSKIGVYTNAQSSVSYLEVGVTAQYRPMTLLESDRFVPTLTLFGGMEGQTFVVEQSLAIDWLMTSTLATFAGVSLREYLSSGSAVQVAPVLGLRASF